MTNNNNMLHWALYYAKNGYPVLPLVPRDKKPLCAHGCKEATTDPEQITRWWTDNPEANIGIATGSGLTVVDVDVDEKTRKDGKAALAQWQNENGSFPETVTATTGRGGTHLLFRTEGNFLNQTNVIEGVDVRGEGGYIVAPPSVHPNGNLYEWNSDKMFTSKDQLQAADEVVIKFLSTKSDKNESAPSSAGKISTPNEAVEYIVDKLGLSFDEGTRNDSLFKLACSLQSRGFEDDMIYSLISEANATRCSTPLPDNEIKASVKSALKYKKGEARKFVELIGDFQTVSEYLAEHFPFILPSLKDDEGFKVSRPRLAAYVRANDHFFFAQTKGEHPAAFWYEDGRYLLQSENEFCGRIKKHIEAFDENLVKSTDLQEVYKLLLTDTKRVDFDELDNNTDIINFRNGILDLNTLELLPHSPEYLSTIQLPLNWNPNAQCPIFENYLNQLTVRDTDVMRLLLEFAGFAISNTNGAVLKKSLFLCGKGDTGKSILLDVLRKILGENYVSTDLKTLEARFGTFALWRKRLAGYADMSFMMVAELKIFKMITGGDHINFEQKGKDAFTDQFRGVLMFCTNEMPKFGGDKGDHVYNRMIIVPCNNVIPPDKQDKNLREKLYTEVEGIVFLLVKNFINLRKRGLQFAIPDICNQALQKYKTSNDNVLQFLSECTLPNEEIERAGLRIQQTSRKEMYHAYKSWAKQNGLTALSNPEFRKALVRIFNKVDISELEVRSSHIRYYIFNLRSNEIRNELLGFWTA